MIFSTALAVACGWLHVDAVAGPPEFRWLNQFAGLPEASLRNVAPTANGFVGAFGARTLPIKWRAPDGSIECHVLIRYENGQWSTTGNVGATGTNNDLCAFFGGSIPVKDVTPFGTGICIGGDFQNVGPDSLRHFACYTEAGGWQQINGPGNGPNGPVEALSYDGFYVYLGGSFTEVDVASGTPLSARRIVRSAGTGWERLKTDDAGTSDGVNGTVTAILPTTSFVYAGVGRSVRRWSSGANDKWTDLGSSNNGTVRDIELNSTLVAAIASGSTTWGGLPAGSVSEYDPGSMEWGAVGSSSGVNTGFSALAIARGFFHATGNFTGVDPDARGIARLNSTLEWEAVPDAAALGTSPEFLDLFALGADICGVQQGTGIGQTFFSRGVACNDGVRWRGLAQGINGEVLDILRYDGAIVAGGEFSAAGDQFMDFIAEYRDGRWQPLGGGLAFTGATPGAPGDVRAMAVYRGELYAMGLFNQADGGSAFGIAAWNGQSWRSVGEGVNFPGKEMLVWKDRLIFTGTSISGKGPVLAWDGNSIEQLPVLPRTPTALAVYQGDLIAAYRPSSTSILVRLAGNSWEPITDTSVLFGLGDINAIAVDGPTLYVGGSFRATQGSTLVGEQVARWNGASWSGLGDGLQSSFFGVEDLILAGNRGLVATGWFDTSGDTRVEKLAYFDGTRWYPLGPGLHNDVVGDTGRTLFMDNGTVYVGGLFDQAGNVWSENIGAFTLKTETILESDFEID
jgi:hypothetical protein